MGDGFFVLAASLSRNTCKSQD